MDTGYLYKTSSPALTAAIMQKTMFIIIRANKLKNPINTNINGIEISTYIK